MKGKKKKFSPALSKLLCNPTTPRQSANLKSSNIMFGFCQKDDVDDIKDFDDTIRKINKKRNNCAKLVEE